MICCFCIAYGPPWPKAQIKFQIPIPFLSEWVGPGYEASTTHDTQKMQLPAVPAPPPTRGCKYARMRIAYMR